MGMFDDILDNVGEPFNNSKGFEYGTHEVVIGSITPKQKDVKNKKGADVIEIEVFDEKDQDRTATCTLYFHTEGGAKMSVAKVLGIMVHNSGEEKKDRVRELGKQLFGSVDSPAKARDVAAKLLTEKMVGKKAYLVAEPNGKYKTTSYGDIWHYPAEPQNKPVDVVATVEGEDISDAVEPGEMPDFGDL